MKKLLILAVAVTSVLSACTNGGGSSSSNGLATKEEKDSISNAMGLLMGAQLKSMKGVEIDANKFAKAVEKAINTKSTDLDAELQKASQFMQSYMTGTVPARLKEKEATYLAGIEKESGVQKTESGLFYKIETPGDGSKPQSTDTVVVNYKGVFIDGEEFDSSYSRNEPTTFPVNQVIPGWSEGIQLIGKGGKIKLYIPAALAYNTPGHPLANQTLIFEVELVDLKPAAPVAPATK